MDSLKTPEDIANFILVNDDTKAAPTKDEEMYLEEISSQLEAFEKCLCFNCIEKWLFSLIHSDDKEVYRYSILRMIDSELNCMVYLKPIYFLCIFIYYYYYYYFSCERIVFEK